MHIGTIYYADNRIISIHCINILIAYTQELECYTFQKGFAQNVTKI